VVRFNNFPIYDSNKVTEGIQMKTIIIKRSEQKKSYVKKLKQLKVMGLDARKYLGKLNINENPVEIQKRLRNEWN